MRILIVSHLYPHTAGSLKGTFVQSQAKAVAQRGCKVTVVAPRLLMPPPLHLLLSRQRELARLPVHRQDDAVSIISPKVWTWPRYLGYRHTASGMSRALLAEWEQIGGEQPDIVHAHVAYPDGVAGLEIAARFKLPLIITVHGRDVLWTLRRHDVREMTLRALRGAHTVLAVSRFLAEELAREGVAAQVLPNGVEVAFLAPEAPGTRETDEPVIVTVANLVPGKGHEPMLRALAELAGEHRFRYLVVGEGPLLGTLRHLSRELGLDGRVEFLGAVPHKEVPAVLARAHLFAMPSKREGFGIASLEAMATGLPVIVSQTAGITDLLVHGWNALLVDPDQQTDLVIALRTLLRDPALRCRLGHEAWATVRSAYTWGAVSERLVGLYRNVIRGSE